MLLPNKNMQTDELRSLLMFMALACLGSVLEQTS